MVLILLGYAITVFVINPWFLIPMSILLLSYFILTKVTSDPLAESKKLDLIYKGPVFSMFSSTISNILSIRVYEQEDNFKKKFAHLLERNTRCNLTFWNLNRIFGFLIEIFTLTASTVGIFTNLLFFSDDRALVGQSILYLISIVEMTNFGFRQLVFSYMMMSSVERNLNYTVLPLEDKLIKKTDAQFRPPNDPRLPDEEELLVNEKASRAKRRHSSSSKSYQQPSEPVGQIKNVWPVAG
jgi:ATP-binding cassette subfamily C (CFTR/MRP) protein 4